MKARTLSRSAGQAWMNAGSLTFTSHAKSDAGSSTYASLLLHVRVCLQIKPLGSFLRSAKGLRGRPKRHTQQYQIFDQELTSISQYGEAVPELYGTRRRKQEAG